MELLVATGNADIRLVAHLGWIAYNIYLYKHMYNSQDSNLTNSNLPAKLKDPCGGCPG